LPKLQSIKGNYLTHLGIDDQSRLWFWGNTVTGFTDGTTYHEQSVPILLTGIKDVTDAYVVERSIIALTADGKVYEASNERESMPANADFRLLASNVNVIKGDHRHIIMQKNDGSLWGWGVNKNSALGYGSDEFMYTNPVPVQKPISVFLNGESIPLTNGVITRNGQNFIPLRSLFEKLGATINFTVDKKITIVRSVAGKPTISIGVNATTGEVSVNNQPVELPNRPFSINGTMYLPLRFMSETLGATVEWLPQKECISITMK
jgi:hypothetical protein